jgi:integral membrane protein (TIGR01906 family)
VTDRSTEPHAAGPRAIATLVVAVATVVVIVTASLLPFLSPVWVGLEQRRAEALAWTGFRDAELTTVTNAIMADLLLGPGAFDVALDGEPVLTDRERGHMRDVRTAFLGLWALTAAAAAILVVLWRRATGRPQERSWFWRAVRRGASGLAIAVVGLGAVALLAFDVLFEVFHRLLFVGGGYTFDPATERLVQLFPFRFWQETAIVVGAVIVLVCGAVTLAARRAGDAATVRLGPEEPRERALGATADTGARS